MISPHRPPFVLAVQSDQQGCAYHRIQVPLGLLVASNLAEGRSDMAFWNNDLLAATQPDVVVFQRLVEDEQFEHCKRYRSVLPNALFVYENDDHLGDIPAASYHEGYIPPDLPERVAQGMSLCDRVTTTTRPLAEWLQSLTDTPVFVVPNAVPMQRLSYERQQRQRAKLRIGWFGGISHAGDLEILRPAMESIGEDVDWVFMGMQPKDPPCRTTLHPGTTPYQYLDHLIQLDLDLALAPLEQNTFNRCKSNLRLLEAACLGVPVIASPIEPYEDGNPPIYAYATGPGDWTEAIRDFMKDTSQQRARNARELRAWAGRYHTLESTRATRVAAWLPEVPAKAKRWAPSPPIIGGATHIDFVLASPGGVDRTLLPGFMRTLKPHRYHDSLEAACRTALETGAHVLWLRPGTGLDEAGFKRLQATLGYTDPQGQNVVASAFAVASDGVNAFPREGSYSVVSPPAEATLRREFARQLVGRAFRAAAPGGPCVLLNAHALAMFGIPDCTHGDEAGLLEWGLRLIPKGMIHVQAADTFTASLAPPQPLSPMAAARAHGRGYAQHAQTPPEPLLPGDREAIEYGLLRTNWSGPEPGYLGYPADYATWTVMKGPLRFASEASARHVCHLSWGDNWQPDATWVLYTDNTVSLRPGALAVLGEAVVRAGKDVRVVYADHDMPQGGRLVPDLKPDFDLELLLGRDYLTQVCAVRVDDLDVFPPRMQDRADLFRAVLHIARTNGPAAFHHVPQILATAQDGEHPEANAMYALHRTLAIGALLSEPDRRIDVEVRRDLPGTLKVVRHRLHGMDPKVSIIIPTLGHGRLIQPAVNTIRKLTDYPNWEILLVHNGPLPAPELTPEILADARVRVVRWDPPADKPGFNWSTACNFGASQASGTYLCFFNDDVNVVSRNWLDAMMGQATRDIVGAVGARLIHPAGMYQHCGVVVNSGIVGHLHKGMPVGNPGYWGIATLTHESAAVTGACILVSRTHFQLIGGFSPDFPLNYGDIDFCLKLRQSGLINVVEAGAELLHAESSTRGRDINPNDPKFAAEMAADIRKFAARWPDRDRYWNPNLAIGTVQGASFLVQGLQCEQLVWKPEMPRQDQIRVLLVNDLPGPAGLAISCVVDGSVPFNVDASGFHVKLICPVGMNIRPWDIRDVPRFADGLSRLGITEIVLRSLVGREGAVAPIEFLWCLKQLQDDFSIQVHFNPIDYLNSAPWLETMRVNDSRLFGATDMDAWKAAFDALFPSIEPSDFMLGEDQRQDQEVEAAK